MSRYRLSSSESRLLRWLATYCSPVGTHVGKVGPTIGRLLERKMVRRGDDAVVKNPIVITGRGLEALLRSGRWQPNEDADRGCRCGCPCHTIDAPHETRCCDDQGRPVDVPRSVGR